MPKQNLKTAFVNGGYLAENQAQVSIFDRGFLFGDGIYEVIAAIDGKLIDANLHLARLDFSLAEIGMASPYSHAELITILHELAERNQFEEGVLYMQFTRGVAPRAFNFPPEDVPITCVAFTLPMLLVDHPKAQTGVKVISIPEQRWARRDIKSVNLLASCLGKQYASEQGAYEAIMIEDDFVTEGTSSTVYIVKQQKVIARPLSRAVLPGVTRRALLTMLKTQHAVELEERKFTVDEVYSADEVFITSASNLVMPVVQIDGHTVGNGKPGELTKMLRNLYITEAMASAI